MTDDLVQRLRSNRPIPTLPHEAADRIEALSAENERLREALSAVTNSYDHWSAVIAARAALQEQSK